jgi:hypothetical protein
MILFLVDGDFDCLWLRKDFNGNESYFVVATMRFYASLVEHAKGAATLVFMVVYI